MNAKTDAAKRSGFLARLLRDQSGNTLAIFAASIFPMVGLVGGAVDMSRVYAVKTRLQAACDAGSLAARKVMANGRWDVNSNSNLTDDAPYQAGMNMFQLNFKDDYLGSENLVVTMTEANGTVTGNASVTLPMVLMQVLGVDEETIAVDCTSQMKIPHSDVMFVLDVTGSMNDPMSGSTKIAGLRRATKCFYEALARQNITDVSPTDCNKTVDPIGDLSTLTQLRFGFVPYDEQVNIGNVLQNSFYSDTQPIQSRRAETEQVWTWTLGTASATSWPGAYSPAIPSTGLSPNIYASGSFSGFANISTGAGGVTTTQGFKQYNRGSMSSTACNNLNTLTTSGGTGGSNTGLTGILPETPGSPGSATLIGTTNNPPTHPNASQVLTYQRSRSVPVRGYRYALSSGNCLLQRSNVRNYTQTDSAGTASRPINWTSRQRITGWTYTQVNFNVAPLKAGGGVDTSTAYNSSLSLPLNESNLSVNLSGQSSSTTIRLVSNTAVAWPGCIEERQTFQNLDGDPSDDWSPSFPDEAFDMDIDMMPDPLNEATRWKFMLPNAAWGRQNGDYVPVTGDLWRATTSSTNGSGMPRNTSINCPTSQARKMTVYRDATGAESFRTYVNALTPGGNTYHDIGLLWGARLMSPTGIFADENATTPDGQEIQRHMVFMTDGATAGDPVNYTPYGIEGWDRRRTDPSINPTTAMLVANTNARTVALCNAIKNMGNNGVTVWVVYYGNADVATRTRMENCATSTSNHFFLASNTGLLIDAFNQIADSISELKLTG